MFNKFKGLVALFSVLCVSIITGASAYFYFGGEAENPIDEAIDNTTGGSNDNGITADNILENYEFNADKDLNETYTYYFYPSTLYMSDDFFNANTMPETVFGYNEVILDDNGDPVLDSKGQPQYKIVKDRITGIKGFTTYYDYLKDYLNGQKSSYLSGSVINTGYGNLPEDNRQTNGNVFDYGVGFKGDDYYLNGFDVSLSDPYVVNNLNFGELIRNLDFGKFIETNQIFHRDYIPENRYTDYVYALSDYSSNLSYSNEVLSPIYNNSLDSINLDLSLSGKADKLYNLKVFSNFYQHNSSSRIGSTNLSVNIEYDWGRSFDDWSNHYKEQFEETISYHSPFYFDNGIKSYDINTILTGKPYLGTWIYRNSNREFQLVFKDDGTGYFSDNNSGEYYYDFGYDISDDNNTITFEKSEEIRGTITIKKDNATDNVVNRAQYRNDRFGFWSPFYDWDDSNNKNFYIENPNSANRYLPIKITVNGNLTPDDMAKVIPTLSASMFDSNMWFDFSANVWTYVTYANTAYNFESKEYTKTTEGYTATGGFTAKDIKNIFDIMQNPSKYADKDGNIRLFPVFSNGKNSGATSVSDGGGDAVQASFSYVNDSSNIENDILPSSTKLTWSSYSYSDASNGFYDNYSVNYAVLNNVEIRKEKFKSITFKIDTTYFDGAPHWGGFWIDVYKLEASTIDEFATTYGEGLYTFYFFLGNRGNNTSLSNETAFPNVNNKSLIENAVSYNDSSNELAHKYLLNIEEPKWPQTDKGQGDQGNGSSVNTPNYSRPVALAVEKVTNLRLVSDIPIAEDENGLPSANQDWDSIDGNIQQGLLNAKNFTIADEVYGFANNIYDEDNIDLSSGKRLDTSNPYIYFIQNADFRFVNNLYFQIRFSNDYINDAMNVTTDYSRIKGKKPDKYVAYSINNQVLKFKFQDSDDGDVFIENATAGSGTDVRQGFKLKDYNARGIYDILLISHETVGYIGTWTGIVGPDNIELVINDDGTLLYNDELYTYTVDGNKITAVDENKSYQLIIVYDETTKSLDVTWKDLNGEHTYHGVLTDFVYKQQYYMYVNRHTNSFIKLFYGNPGTFKFDTTGSGDTTSVNNFVSHKLPSEDDTPDGSQTRHSSSTLLWNGQTYLGEYLTTSSTGTRYYQSGSGEEKPIQDPNSDNSLYAAIREKCGLTPGKDNIYKIIDAVTGRVVAYYNSGIGRVFTSEGSAGSGNSDDAINLFAIMKNYVLYIDPTPLNSVTS